MELFQVPAVGDAFGMTLQAQLPHLDTPGVVAEIIERDDGDIVANDASTYFRGLHSWNSRTVWALGKVRGRVLDIGVGAGRHALELQSTGLDVVGIDQSVLAVDVCRTRGLRKAVNLSLDRVPELGQGKFDTLLFLGQNLTLIGSGDDGIGRLRMLHEHANPGAIIIGDTISPIPYLSPSAVVENRQTAGRGAREMHAKVRLRVRWRRYATAWSVHTYSAPDSLARLCFRGGWNLSDLRADGQEYTAILHRRRMVSFGSNA